MTHSYHVLRSMQNQRTRVVEAGVFSFVLAFCRKSEHGSAWPDAETHCDRS